MRTHGIRWWRGLAMLLLAAPLLASSAVQLLDETVIVPRGGTRSIHVMLQQQPAVVVFRYANLRGGEGVRAVLLTEAEAEKFRHGESYDIVATTPYGASGQITKSVASPGDYELVFDNTLETGTRAVVRWQAELLFGHGEVPPVSYLPTARRVAVFSLSGLFLVAMVMFTAGRVRGALVRRNSRESYWPPEERLDPNEPLT